jgi:hypothetical protein
VIILDEDAVTEGEDVVSNASRGTLRIIIKIQNDKVSLRSEKIELKYSNYVRPKSCSSSTPQTTGTLLLPAKRSLLPQRQVLYSSDDWTDVKGSFRNAPKHDAYKVKDEEEKANGRANSIIDRSTTHTKSRTRRRRRMVGQIQLLSEHDAYKV